MHVHCPRCQHRVQTRSRSRLWWVALVALSALFVGLILAASLIGPFITLGVFLLSSVGFAFGPLHSLLAEEPTCPRCGRSLAARYMPEPPVSSVAIPKMVEQTA